MSHAKDVRYWPALDGLRGVAISLVLLNHVDVLRGGFVGVDVFFCLSGFLITSLLVAESQQRGSISLPRFWARRALRLVPALTVAVLGYISVMAVIGRLTLDRVLGALYGLFYVSNWTQAVGLQKVGPSHLWSLATEEQFYLLWPPILMLLLARGSRHRSLIALGVTLLVLGLEKLILIENGVSWQRLYFAPDTRATAIVIGCLLALWRTSSPDNAANSRASRFVTFAAPASLLLILILAAFVPGHDWAPIYLPGLELVGTATAIVILAAIDERDPMLSTILSQKPLVMLGKVSYSLYLWHPLVGNAVEGIIGPSPRWVVTSMSIVASVATAVISYVAIEEPFLRLKDRFARYRATRPVPLSVTTEG